VVVVVKAVKGLQVQYPRMVHLTCFAHALYGVSEEIRDNYPDDNKFISNVKKMFFKAPLRVQKFKQDSPSFSLSPQPVLMRWVTWLEDEYVNVKTTL
jgi:hypothetical protein